MFTVFTTNLSLSFASLAKESGISAFAMMRSTGFSLRSSFPCVRTDTAAPHLKYAHVKKVIVFIYENLLEIICTYLVSKGFQSSANWVFVEAICFQWSISNCIQFYALLICRKKTYQKVFVFEEVSQVKFLVRVMFYFFIYELTKANLERVVVFW